MSMAEVVIDDMAIGNPVSSMAQLALLSLVPGIHIAQFPYQVIGNCGVISLMQRSNGGVCSGPQAGPAIFARTIAGWRGAQYDGIVASAACGYFERGPGVSLMMVVMVVAGVGCLLAGLLAIGFGFPVKEFSFGNTLILTGAVTACTGLVILGLWAVVSELKNIAQRLGPGAPLDTALQPKVAAAPTRHHAGDSGGFLFGRDQSAAEEADGAESGAQPSAPWREEAAARDRARTDAPLSAPEPVEAVPAVKPRRNLMFSSSSRRERERAQAREAESPATDFHPAPAAMPPPSESSEAPPPTFDDAWPRPERSRSADAPPQRRGGRAPSTFSEAPVGAVEEDHHAPAARNEDPPPVTVLKSGVVDGMAYSLYSDGSIEAQMPEGMMRFASIDELRSHLDQRP
jgi:hypothetical protein